MKRITLTLRDFGKREPSEYEKHVERYRAWLWSQFRLAAPLLTADDIRLAESHADMARPVFS